MTYHENPPAVPLGKTESFSPAWEKKKHFTSPHELQQKLNSFKKKKNSPRRVLNAPTSVLPFLRFKKRGKKGEKKQKQQQR